MVHENVEITCSKRHNTKRGLVPDARPGREARECTQQGSPFPMTVIPSLRLSPKKFLKKDNHLNTYWSMVPARNGADTIRLLDDGCYA